MVDPNIEKLLVLQDRDMRRHNLEKELARIPAQIDALKENIAREETNRETARERVRDLEVARKSADNEITAAEQQVTRYKNQQLEVKKNDEYKALNHEIDITLTKISELEEKTLGLMIEIDEEKTRLSAIEADFENKIGELNEKIKVFKEREGILRQEVDEATKLVEEARSDVPPVFLTGYDRHKQSIQFPVVTPIRDRKCQGCHLRVSGEVETDVRNKEEITTCDNCGRIVYMER